MKGRIEGERKNGKKIRNDLSAYAILFRPTPSLSLALKILLYIYILHILHFAYFMLNINLLTE